MCCGQAKPLLDAKQVKEIADPRLEDQYDPVEMEIAMATASMCIHHMSSKRPYMSQVTKITDLININPFFYCCLWYNFVRKSNQIIKKIFIQ